MENRLRKSVPGVLEQVGSALEGLKGQGATLGLRLVEAETMEADLQAFGNADALAKQEHGQLVKRWKAHQDAVKAGRAFVFAARDLQKPYFGQRPGAQWEQVGFKRSLRVPREAIHILILLRAMAAYLADHPTRGHTELQITSARATALAEELVAANAAVLNQTTKWKQAIGVRNKVRTRLHGQMRALLKELSVRLEPMHPTWEVFGFNKPGFQPIPDAPEKPVAAGVYDTAATVKWEKIPRAKAFRVFKRVVEKDKEMVAVARVKGFQFTFEDLPPGSTVEVVITAINPTGESGRSEVLRFELPVPMVKEPEETPPEAFDIKS